MELLAGQEWGGVKFKGASFLEDVYGPGIDYGDRSARKHSFRVQVDAMSNLADADHFEVMKASHFFPGLPWPMSVKITNPVKIEISKVDVFNTGLFDDLDFVVAPWIALKDKHREAGTLAGFKDNGCVNLKFLYPNQPAQWPQWQFRLWWLQDRPRCMVRVTPDGKMTEGLTSMADVKPLGDGFPSTEAWERILLVANGDDDSDGILNDADLCPDTAALADVDANGCSDAQVDEDSDGVCDPGAPSAGPSACEGEDLCPATAPGAPVGRSGCSDAQVDSDGDGVCNPGAPSGGFSGCTGSDVCPETVIPESVPTFGLKPYRWALTDDADPLEFDTIEKGKGPGRSYTTTDTAGCSCEQIIAEQGLGKGHTKHGCSIGAMDGWVGQVSP